MDSVACFLLVNSQHFHGQTLRDTRAEIERTGDRLRTGKGSKTAPLWVPSSFGAEKSNAGAKKTKPRRFAAGFCADRSGARRSQEQGESRMTVLPGARNRRSWPCQTALLPESLVCIVISH